MKKCEQIYSLNLSGNTFVGLVPEPESQDEEDAEKEQDR